MSVTYNVSVTTGASFMAGSFDRMSITLVGSRGSSAKTRLKRLFKKTYFMPGSTLDFDVSSDVELGEILLVRLHKQKKHFALMEDSWYCSAVTVTRPSCTRYTFPVHSWLTDENTLHVMEGAARRKSQYEGGVLQQHWIDEIKARQEDYQWDSYIPDIPRNIKGNSTADLPKDAQFTVERKVDLLFDLDRLCLQFGFTRNNMFPRKSFFGLEHIHQICSRKSTPTSAYVAKHWKEDPFFGYQYLNGSNPVLIRQCRQLPPNLPLTDQMVAPSLGPDTSLQQQLQAGNLYVVDYEILRGITPHIRDGEQQYLSAPICLLYLTPDRALIPIAIQVDQDPGPHNPIFLPSDPKYTWRLAKIWVRHADTQVHQIVSHLLRTHLFAEVFCVAAMRTLPNAHPLFKLLMPHLKLTLQVNTEGRQVLLSEGGAVDRAFSTGGVAKAQVLQRATERTTYTSLCLPEELASRGVDKLPNYYYRDDGLRIWGAISSLVQGVVELYYEDNGSVGRDSELQAFVTEIFTEGFLSRGSSGFPTSLNTKAELIKYLTMIIFTCTAQHSALNGGQFDWGLWMPNNPSTMRRPPPTDKCPITEDHICQSLPDVATTIAMILIVHSLSRQTPSAASLGLYIEERFTEPGPRECIERFQSRLKQIKKEIDSRNEGLELPYVYLRPDLIENSVAI